MTTLTEVDATDQHVLPPPTEAEITSMDAWWRANNYWQRSESS